MAEAVPLHRLAQIMGHDSLNTTLLYVRGAGGGLIGSAGSDGIANGVTGGTGGVGGTSSAGGSAGGGGTPGGSAGGAGSSGVDGAGGAGWSSPNSDGGGGGGTSGPGNSGAGGGGGYGNAYMRMRDVLGPISTNAEFAPLFKKEGRPAAAPAHLALVTIMQFAEGLSDAQAADAVRSRIDWKYALALELTDPGFDSSVLSEFRDRLLDGAVEQRLFDSMLAVFRDHGLLTRRGRQRTDSTHVLAAIRALSRLELLGETVRHVLNDLAVQAPDWLCTWVPTDWFERYRHQISVSLTNRERCASAPQCPNRP